MHWGGDDPLRNHALGDGDESLVSRGFESGAFAQGGEERNGLDLKRSDKQADGLRVVRSSLGEELRMVDVWRRSLDPVGGFSGDDMNDVFLLFVLMKSKTFSFSFSFFVIL